jgi:hypothetical protein
LGVGGGGGESNEMTTKKSVTIFSTALLKEGERSS